MAQVSLPLQFPTPPLDLTHQEALPGNPYSSGHYLFDRVRGPINCDAYGIYFKAFTVPPGFGVNVGAKVTYDRDWLQLLEVKEDILSNVQDGPYLSTRAQEGIFMFDEFPILRVVAQIYPGCTANFWWVVVF